MISITFIPIITVSVMGYVFLTALLYLGFHPGIVTKLNKALNSSDLPKYRIEQSHGMLTIKPENPQDDPVEACQEE